MGICYSTASSAVEEATENERLIARILLFAKGIFYWYTHKRNFGLAFAFLVLSRQFQAILESISAARIKLLNNTNARQCHGNKLLRDCLSFEEANYTEVLKFLHSHYQPLKDCTVDTEYKLKAYISGFEEEPALVKNLTLGYEAYQRLQNGESDYASELSQLTEQKGLTEEDTQLLRECAEYVIPRITQMHSHLQALVEPDSF